MRWIAAPVIAPDLLLLRLDIPSLRIRQPRVPALVIPPPQFCWDDIPAEEASSWVTGVLSHHNCGKPRRTRLVLAPIDLPEGSHDRTPFRGTARYPKFLHKEAIRHGPPLYRCLEQFFSHFFPEHHSPQVEILVKPFRAQWCREKLMNRINAEATAALWLCTGPGEAHRET